MSLVRGSSSALISNAHPSASPGANGPSRALNGSDPGGQACSPCGLLAGTATGINSCNCSIVRPRAQYVVRVRPMGERANSDICRQPQSCVCLTSTVVVPVV